MEYRYSPGAFTAPLGVYLQDEWGWDFPGYFFYKADPVPYWLTIGTVLPIGTWRAEDMINDIRQNIPDVALTVLKSAPESEVYDDRQDRFRYGNYLAGYSAFMGALGLCSQTGKTVGNENQVTHVTLPGRVRPGPLRSSWYTKSADRSQISTRFYPVGDFTQYEIVDTVGQNLVWKYTPDWSHVIYEWKPAPFTRRPWPKLSDRVADIRRLAKEDNLWGITPEQGFYNFVAVENFVARQSNLNWEIEYDIEWHTDNRELFVSLDPMYNGRAHNKLRFTVLPRQRGAPYWHDYSVFAVDSPVKVVVDFQSTCTRQGGSYLPHPGPVVGSVFTPPVREYSLALLLDPITLEGTHAVNTTRISQHDPSRILRSNVEAVMDDLRCAAYLTTSSALDNLIGSLNTDLVETLNELPEIAGTIPDLKAFLGLLSEMTSTPGVGTIGRGIKLLSSEHLRFIFGSKPNIDLMVNVLPKVGKVIERLARLESHSCSGYGTLSFDFPTGEFGRVQSKLVVRTKVVANNYPSDDLAKVLALHSIGLLPTPSRFWDCVPLSFVYDWFSNIGGRLSALENAALLATFDLKCLVHSYTVTSLLEERDLDAMGLRLDGSDLPEIKVYKREVSLNLPTPRTGRYDFAMPTRPPDLATVGSLLVSLL